MITLEDLLNICKTDTQVYIKHSITNKLVSEGRSYELLNILDKFTLDRKVKKIYTQYIMHSIRPKLVIQIA